MANVELNTSFKDGDFLFAEQLNNNFKAIKAALEAMNKIVWQDEQELPDSITAFRGTTEELMNREIIDGQLLYDTNTGETYIDYEGRRISTGSGNAIHIGEDEPSNASTQLWIPTDEFNSVGTEVVNSLEGDETAKAPSVDAVKKGLLDKYSTEEQIIGKDENGKNVYKQTFKGVTTNGTHIILTKKYNKNNIIMKKAYGSVVGGPEGAGGVNLGAYVTENYYCGIFIHPEELQLYYSKSLVEGTYEVTIEFTKTTD